MQIPSERCRSWKHFRTERQRIGLVDETPSAAENDVVLVPRAGRQAGKEAFPYSRTRARRQLTLIRTPPVEVADHADSPGIGSPHREVQPFDPLLRDVVRPKLLVEPVVCAFSEEVEVQIGEQAWPPAKRLGR